MNFADSELKTAASWAGALTGKAETGSPLSAETVGLPFSFVYGGRRSADLLPNWVREAEVVRLDDRRTAHNAAYTDPDTGLQVRIEAVVFADFPAVEWVMHLKNTGPDDTPVVEDIQPLDATFTCPGGAPTLHYAKGAVCSIDDYKPLTRILGQGEGEHIQPGGGRSSSDFLPFFNIERTPGEGLILAIGWSGEWAADFRRDNRDNLRIRGGMDLTHLKLHPGEQIRTPRILTLFWQGDRARSQNMLRRFILAHHRPKVNGKPVEPLAFNSSRGGTPASDHLMSIKAIAEHDLPIDYYWIDAEWFGKGQWTTNVGDWSVKNDLYPDGFKPVSDALHESGRKFLLWFEPERVCAGTPWAKEHRQWLLDVPKDKEHYNRGVSQADPHWAELLRRHPGLIIDNCASGGRRIDIQSLSLSTPFWRTDYPNTSTAKQCHTFGMLSWVPLNATGHLTLCRAGDYEFRSTMSSSVVFSFLQHDGETWRVEPPPADYPWDKVETMLTQYRDIRKYFLGDYYPLTEYSQAEDAWMVYQLDLPETGEGLIVALKRPLSSLTMGSFALKALDRHARYQIADLDSGKSETVSGAFLTDDGLRIALTQSPASCLIGYRRIG